MSLWLRRAFVLGAGLAVALTSAANAGEYNLTVDPVIVDTGTFKRTGIGYNGATPGPVLRFTEGEDVTINVVNNLDETTSIHWHGLILPFDQDGVPGISYPGIPPGETFTYRFPIVQNGTYWFHSHSGFQEPDGAYGSIVIEPKKGVDTALADRAAWGDMRMMPTDIEDLQGFTPLINGKSTEQNWTGLFKPGERVRLRFINSSAMAYFDVRIPGLKMTVVQADGNNVLPVPVDEFRIAVAETYDVLVQPKEDQAYAIFAESMGRTASVRATLATSEGMVADAPELRKPSLLTMADMGMAHEGMDHGSMSMGGMSHTMPDGRAMQGMNHGAMNQGQTNHGTGQMSDTHKMPDGSSMKGMSHAGTDHSGGGGMPTMKHDGTAMAQEGHTMPDGSIMKGTSHGGMNHGAQGMMAEADSFYAPGSGLTPSAANGGKFLSYDDLRAQKPLYEYREATREVELRLTGNMERYIWSINGIKFADADPIRLKYGERVRFKFVNETMMTHPMHLHGMWTILDTGSGARDPIKHTVSVAPGTTVFMETEVDAPGQWAFHCHLSYHADSGMFRKVVVEGGPKDKSAATTTNMKTGG